MTQEHDVSRSTIDLFEARLRRITFALTGTLDNDVQPTADSKETAAARLRMLDRQLANLAAKSSVVSQVLDLQSKWPRSFFSPSESTTESDLAPAALATLVLTHAQQYQHIATQLSTLAASSVPDAKELATLVGMQSRIDQAAERQAHLAHQVPSLRTRSAQLLELWYTNGVLEMSENWTDWEERLKDVEILVRRMEAFKKRDDGLI